jgi:hypothetical protein
MIQSSPVPLPNGAVEGGVPPRHVCSKVRWILVTMPDALDFSSCTVKALELSPQVVPPRAQLMKKPAVSAVGEKAAPSLYADYASANR